MIPFFSFIALCNPSPRLSSWTALGKLFLKFVHFSPSFLTLSLQKQLVALHPSLSSNERLYTQQYSSLYTQ